MTKSIRKYRSWLMAGFMILLMLAWLGAPASNGVGQIRKNRTVGKIDGSKVSADDMVNASKEITALQSFVPRLFAIEDRDSTHWLLLSREAERAGYVGEGSDGEDFIPAIAREMLQSDFQLLMQLQQMGLKTQQEALDVIGKMIRSRFASQGMNTDEANAALAKMRGVYRMLTAYRGVQRFSDREVASLAKDQDDAAIVDLVAIPASLSADAVPDPSEADLQAQFDKFKGTKPGEGDFGIGYLLPRRVKLEWLTLSRDDFEKAVQLDPIEVRKRYAQNHPAKYAGEFAAERDKVEKDMRGEAADRGMQDAQLVVQSAIVRETRLLENDGTTKYKKLPADWDAKRPKLDAIAQAVADEAKKGGLSIPLPAVTVRSANWLTEQDLSQAPGIGRSTMRQGGVSKAFVQVVGWTRELPGSEAGIFPIQINVPVGENYLVDAQGNRYYLNILATRGESAPDSVDEIKELATKDYKNLRAFEGLKARLEEFRKAAADGGLDAVVALVTGPAPIIADPGKKDDKKPEVRKSVRVTRQALPDAQLNDESVRKAVIDAAAGFDPMAAYASLDPQKATLALPAPKHLSVGVFRIQAYSPLTQEGYRRADGGVIEHAQQAEMPTKFDSPDYPFSLAGLLKRHDYISNGEPIRTVEQLRRHDKSE